MALAGWNRDLQPVTNQERVASRSCGGTRLLRDPLAQQGLRVLPGGTRASGPARALAPWPADHRAAGRARAGTGPRQGRQPGKIHRPGRPARSQRDALLPRPDREPGRALADRLHADGGPGLPALQPHRPQSTRSLDHARRHGRHPLRAPQRPQSATSA